VAYSRPMSRPSCLLACCAAGLATLPVGAASARTKDRGLLGIAPVRRLVTHRPPVALAPIQFSNTTRLRYDVRVFPALLGQRIDGTIFVRDDRRSLAVARRIVTLEGRRAYVMGPDQREAVTVRWRSLPKGVRAVALGAVFQAKARVPPGQLNNIVRLVNSNFLTLPGAGKRDIVIRTITTEQGPGPGRTLLLSPVVANRGETFEQPRRARVAILDDRDRVVAEKPFDGDIVFPRATRRYPVVFRKLLPAGDYTALAAFRVHGLAPVIGRARFTLVGPNRLPTGRLQLLSVRADGEARGAAHGSVEIVNTGNLDVAPRLAVALYRHFQGQRLPGALASTTRDAGSLKPRARRTVDFALGRLEDGEGYEVVVRATAPNAPAVTATAQFVARAHRSLWERFKRWIGDHPIVVIAVGLLLGLLLILALLRRQARGRGQRPTAAAGGPAPAAPGLVDVNTADVAALQTLPGVGPRAAQRIADHRDEYGPFSSLDDLRAVEGFDEGRIDGLRGRATT
jgi:competence ComEA-like helix-hairpin-helix protein